MSSAAGVTREEAIIMIINYHMNGGSRSLEEVEKYVRAMSNDELRAISIDLSNDMRDGQ